MANNRTNDASSNTNVAAVQPELLVSGVLHLMSHYTAARDESRDCSRLASMIERHLKALADLPGLSPVLRATCRQLSEQWEDVVDRAIRASEKRPLFRRLVTSARVE